MAKITGTGAVLTDHRTTETVDGTSYQGRVYLSYDRLVETFGEPDKTENLDKSHYQWQIATPNGLATIYDWKRNEDPRDGGYLTWCIGGRVPEVAEWVLFAIHDPAT